MPSFHMVESISVRFITKTSNILSNIICISNFTLSIALSHANFFAYALSCHISCHPTHARMELKKTHFRMSVLALCKGAYG